MLKPDEQSHALGVGEGGALSESLYCVTHIYYDFTNKNNQLWGSIEYLSEDPPGRGNPGGSDTPTQYYRRAKITVSGHKN